MSRSRRFWPMLLVVALLVGLLGIASPASADISSVTVDPTGEILTGDRVRVHGTVTCDPGVRWRLRARVTQSIGEITLYRGVGRDFGHCTGEPEPWSVVTNPHRGTPSPGPAEVCWVVRTPDDRAHGCSPVILT